MSKNKKQEEAKAGAPAWMATFSDLMTQILVFFIFLFTMSSLDIIKFRSALISFSSTFGGYSTLKETSLFEYKKLISYPETNMDKHQGSQNSELNESATEKALQEIMFLVRANDMDEYIIGKYNEQGNLEIIIREPVLFKSGNAQLQDEAFKILESIASSLLQMENNIIIEGHTDNLPPSSSSEFSSNWELSSARALTVANIFIDKIGIEPARIAIAGYGEHRPLVSNTTKENRAMNRRVSVVIVKDLWNRVY
jgi:chemotaxis protein MotB